MFRRWSIIMASVLISACSSEEKTEVKIPSYVLDKEKFSDVICDFTLAEAAANMNIKNQPLTRADSVYAFNPLTDNGIDKPTFDTSLYFYSRHPALFKEVYQMVLEKLSRMQASRK